MNYEPSTEPDFEGLATWAKFPISPSPLDPYFDSYSSPTVHEEILQDKPHIKAFKDAIFRNKYLFSNKTVLDLGCGTGLLSFFAAKAGAKHVYAVDNAHIISSAAQIASHNVLPNITFLQGTIETVTLPVSSVDIIISDWMGHFLLYENMLESLIYARNKYLAPGGVILPDKARIIVAAIEDAKYKDETFEFWNDVYGIDMAVMRRKSMAEAQVDEVPAESIISTSCPVYCVDLNCVQMEDVGFVNSYTIQFTRKEFMHGLVAWFEVEFAQCHRPIVINTSPREEVTRWKQTVFYLESSQPVDVGEIMRGTVAVKLRDQCRRELDVKISCNIESKTYPLHSVSYYSIKR
jgi:type I protein arginine methyltransferase